MTTTNLATKPKNASKYQRVLLKVSGEALMGDQPYGQDLKTIQRIAADIKEVVDLGVQVCVVVGGGNIFRGIQGASQGMERASADYMGMIATIMNALAMQNIMEQMGVPTRVQSALEMQQVAEPYIRRRAVRHMEKGRVVIFAGGTGLPYFTTDTTAALRASEIQCDALLKGTQVDGVYDSDPRKNKDAKRFETLSYHDVLAKDLKVMDAAAISLARENQIPIIVCSIHESGNIARVLTGTGQCTTITDKK